MTMAKQPVKTSLRYQRLSRFFWVKDKVDDQIYIFTCKVKDEFDIESVLLVFLSKTLLNDDTEVTHIEFMDPDLAKSKYDFWMNDPLQVTLEEKLKSLLRNKGLNLWDKRK